MTAPPTLAEACLAALRCAVPEEKAGLAAALTERWRAGGIVGIGTAHAPDRPARPDRPVLLPPRDMPRRGKGFGIDSRIALLHALAHIELNAVDLACDIVARFAGEDLPEAFFRDWAGVAAEEGVHFRLLSRRLADFGAAYGDLPAHDGLWEAATTTSHDVLARLAVVPLVLEARGLDVTPAIIANLRRAGDPESVDILEKIYREEVGHVATGRYWFEWICAERGLQPMPAYHALVRKFFRGSLKPPFNAGARSDAGLGPGFYEPLAASGPSSN